MDCKEARLMAHGYADGELDVLTTARIESHVRTCLACQKRLCELAELRAAIKTAAPYFEAPAGLQKRIQTGLRKSDKKRWPVSLIAWRWPIIGAAIGSAALFSMSLALVMNTPSADDLIAREVISSHVRSLMADHLTDVRSTDRHTVKPWFIGLLDFSPPVNDLTSRGFVLVGGRLDYLDNRQTAALVYQYRKHIINLFIWPAPQEQTSSIKVHRWQGYQAYAWTQAGMHFWAVSEVNENDLSLFARLLRDRSSGQPASRGNTLP